MIVVPADAQSDLALSTQSSSFNSLHQQLQPIKSFLSSSAALPQPLQPIKSVVTSVANPDFSSPFADSPATLADTSAAAQSDWTAHFPSMANQKEDAELTALRLENETLRKQLEKIGELGSGGGACDFKMGEEVEALRGENATLVQKVARQADELVEVKLERESLLEMLQRLQDDLETSEKLRTRASLSSN